MTHFVSDRTWPAPIPTASLFQEEFTEHFICSAWCSRLWKLALNTVEQVSVLMVFTFHGEKGASRINMSTSLDYDK